MRLFDEALRLQADHEFAWNNKGLCLDALGRLDEAKGCYRRAIRANKNSWRALCNLGMLESRLGNAEAALECCLRLKALGEKNSTIHLSLCAVYFNLGRVQDALAELCKAGAIDPSSHELRLMADAVESAWREQKDG